MKLKELGEFGFIDRIRHGTITRPAGVIKGIGDDCAVTRAPGGRAFLFTTDLLVEDVHFRRAGTPPFKLGRKALAVNLSDIAAMGGEPKEALVAVAIPDMLEVEYLDRIYEGMRSMAAGYKVNLLGGDTARSPGPLLINVTLTGEGVEEEILYRSGARPGDVLFLTGPIGSSAAGLDMILSGRSFDQGDVLLDAHLDPRPHVEAGRIMARLRAVHSLIDVSDGLAGDLGHLCEDSGVGALIEEARIPTTEAFRAYCKRHDLDPLPLLLNGGEDYVLLGSVPEKASGRVEAALRDGGYPFFRIGRILEEPGIRLLGRNGTKREILPKGWDHFRNG